MSICHKWTEQNRRIPFTDRVEALSSSNSSNFTGQGLDGQDGQSAASFTTLRPVSCLLQGMPARVHPNLARGCQFWQSYFQEGGSLEAPASQIITKCGQTALTQISAALQIDSMLIKQRARGAWATVSLWQRGSHGQVSLSNMQMPGRLPLLVDCGDTC